MSDWKTAGNNLSKTVCWEKDSVKENQVYLGDVITGVYKKLKTDVGANSSNVYEIENESGLFSVWGTTVLDAQMEEVPLGSEVQITHLGKKIAKDGKTQFRGFEVKYRPAPMKTAGQGSTALPPV